MIVTEIFDSELLGEGILPTMRHAAKHLLKVCSLQSARRPILSILKDCVCNDKCQKLSILRRASVICVCGQPQIERSWCAS